MTNGIGSPFGGNGGTPPSVFFNTPTGAPPAGFGAGASSGYAPGAPYGQARPQPALTPFGTPGTPRMGVAAFADPDPPAELIAFVQRCHAAGKPVSAEDTLPWRALQLLDINAAEGGVIHEVPYLTPDVVDLDLVHTLWERIKARVRLYDDALPHHFMVDVVFADDTGRFLAVHETCDVGPVVLPRQNSEWGSQTGMQTRGAFGMGGTGLGAHPSMMRHPAPHHAAQEIDMAAMHMAGIREVFGMFGMFMRHQQDENRELRGQFIPVMTLFREMVEDREKKIREHEEWTIKMKLLTAAFERSLPLLQYCGLQLMDVVKRKFDKRPPKSGREVVAFNVLKEIVAGVQRSGMASTPADLWPLLQRMGITDTRVYEDLQGMLMEIGLEAERLKAEESVKANSLLAGLLGGGGANSNDAALVKVG